MRNKFFINNQNIEEFIEVEARPITPPVGMEHLDLFFTYVYESFRVSEGKTGALIAMGDTPREAFRNAWRRLFDKYSIIDSTISKCIKENGLSPRYAYNREMSK